MISLTMLLSSISASYHASLPGDCFVPQDDFSQNHIRAKGSSLSLFLQNNLFYPGTHFEVAGISRRMFLAAQSSPVCHSLSSVCLAFGSINCSSTDTQIFSPTHQPRWWYAGAGAPTLIHFSLNSLKFKSYSGGSMLLDQLVSLTLSRNGRNVEI